MTNQIKPITQYFDGHYVPLDLLDTYLSDNINYFIHKNSTGMGMTTAILNYTKSNYIILSPCVGMIKSKEGGKYNSHKQFFIYGNSTDSWDAVERYLTLTPIEEQNLIINITPDQLIGLSLSRGSLLLRLITIPIFIDEQDYFAHTAGFRVKVGECLAMIRNIWEAKHILSTATPNYNYIDVPRDIPMEYIKLVRKSQTKKNIQYTNDINNLKIFVDSEIKLGHKVVICSNDFNIHKKFTNYRVENLTGDNLAIKLAPYGRGAKYNTDQLDLTNTDIIFLSSANFAGFDINMDCSIVVISNQKNNAYKISVNSATQCFGRCRKYLISGLFINILADLDVKGKAITIPTRLHIENAINLYEKLLITYKKMISDLGEGQHASDLNNNCITKLGFVNQSLLVGHTLRLLDDYILYNTDIMKQKFDEYNYIIIDYVPAELDEYSVDRSIVLTERLMRIKLINMDKLLLCYNEIKYNIARDIKTKNKPILEPKITEQGLEVSEDYEQETELIQDVDSVFKGAFNLNLALEYLTAYILKNCSNNIINNALFKKHTSKLLYSKINKFIRINTTEAFFTEVLSESERLDAGIYINSDTSEFLNKHRWVVNEWIILYQVFKLSHLDIPESILRDINIAIVSYSPTTYLPELNNKKNRVRNVLMKIIKYNSKYPISSPDEQARVVRIVKKMFETMDDPKKEYVNYNTLNNAKNKMKWALAQLYTQNRGTNVTHDRKPYRIYNDFTQLPRAFRPILPIKLVQHDMTSANAQLIDRIIGSNIGLSVYENLALKRGIKVKEAKIEYNRALNKWQKYNKRTSKLLYLDCGYTEDQAERLASLTANGVYESCDQKFHNIITEVEQESMAGYANWIHFNVGEFCKVIPLHDAGIVYLEHIEGVRLPIYVDGYKFSHSMFHSNEPYLEVTEEKQTVLPF